MIKIQGNEWAGKGSRKNNKECRIWSFEFWKLSLPNLQFNIWLIQLDSFGVDLLWGFLVSYFFNVIALSLCSYPMNILSVTSCSLLLSLHLFIPKIVSQFLHKNPHLFSNYYELTDFWSSDNETSLSGFFKKYVHKWIHIKGDCKL